MDKKVQALIKRDTYEHWNMATKYIPANGIIIIIDMPDGSVKLKFGDGETLLRDLPDILEQTNNVSNSHNAPVYTDEILEFR